MNSGASALKTTLYAYYRSSCSYRVRIALNLKKISYEIVPINLFKKEAEPTSSVTVTMKHSSSKEESTDNFKTLNAKAEVPVLRIDGKLLTQSIPIIEYLDETRPSICRLLPEDIFQRFQARRIAEIIASGIQPLQNRAVLEHVGAEKKQQWAQHYISKGLHAVEKVLEQSAGTYCVGDQISIADCCVAPQLYHARAWKIDLKQYPILKAVDERLSQIEGFQMAHPRQQIDCPPNEKQIL